ncbi:hypothetical protein [Sphingomonas nostoxanthinifaciens]|uniref:hypothetical protein n=1 Tax=Sphingomonas nostoxanthinifaciens TaxID=2872652 RepID=UPI001CC1F5CB|nr:hypothetical protein [Sphingomonas nostoxanthinifaciens]UAK23682.1 hypothetical protein K8P63_15020 [Sphingomonas nostoxanthinifaciens]
MAPVSIPITYMPPHGAAALAIAGAAGSPVVGGNAALTPVISGGTGPYALTKQSGALPGGRSIAGLSVTGTYTAAGTFNYVLRVTDSKGATADLAVTEVVTAAGTTPGTVDFSDPSGTGLGLAGGII